MKRRKVESLQSRYHSHISAPPEAAPRLFIADLPFDHDDTISVVPIEHERPTNP
jgi:hypothetical protein